MSALYFENVTFDVAVDVAAVADDDHTDYESDYDFERTDFAICCNGGESFPGVAVDLNENGTGSVSDVHGHPDAAVGGLSVSETFGDGPVDLLIWTALALHSNDGRPA